MSSFRKINYNLRPAKAVERKMISFALKKLIHFDMLSNYQYVGFGSTYFSDFVLFHKELGIEKMISIESSGNKGRFQFNKPFHCIEMKFGYSNQMLPQINWSDKTILWLDYDKTIREDYLNDVSTFFNSADSGSCFIITLNADPEIYGNDNKSRRDAVINAVGKANIYHNSELKDFSKINFPSALKKIVDARILSELKVRNGGESESDKLAYKQIFNFTYADGVKMLTIGGVLLKGEDLDRFDNINFKEYSFLEFGDENFNINVPKLTLKEVRFLNSMLPNGVDEFGKFTESILPTAANPNIPFSEVKDYKKIYNFFPLYTETLNL